MPLISRLFSAFEMLGVHNCRAHEDAGDGQEFYKTDQRHQFSFNNV